GITRAEGSQKRDEHDDDSRNTDTHGTTSKPPESQITDSLQRQSKNDSRQRTKVVDLKPCDQHELRQAQSGQHNQETNPAAAQYPGQCQHGYKQRRDRKSTRLNSSH